MIFPKTGIQTTHYFTMLPDFFSNDLPQQQEGRQQQIFFKKKPGQRHSRGSPPQLIVEVTSHCGVHMIFVLGGAAGGRIVSCPTS